MIDNIFVSETEIENFFNELRKITTKNEMDIFVQKNQWIIMNLDTENYERYQNELELFYTALKEKEFESDIRNVELYNKAIAEGLTDEEARAYVESVRRNEDRIKEERKLETIKNIVVSDIDNIKQEAALSQKIGLMDKWVNLCEKRSYYNQIPAKIMLHVVIGQVLKDLTFKIGNGKEINLKCSMWWFQNSRSGKGQMVNVLIDVLKGLDLKWLDMKGDESDATLLRHFRYKTDVRKGYDFSEEVPGLLEQYDFYIYREASCLIKTTPISTQTAKYFLHILEGEPIPKTLEKWDGHTTLTYGKGSLIATSRPVSSINRFIVEAGLLQRCLCYMRKLTDEEREKMTEKVSLLSMSNNSSKVHEEYKLLVMEVTKDLINIKKWAFENCNKIMIKNEDEINSYIHKEVSALKRKVTNNLRDPTYEEIANSFIGGWIEYIPKLTYQNAIMRMSINVELQDVVNAISIINECYDQFELWVQESVIPDERMSKQLFDYYKYIRYLIDQKRREGKPLLVSEAVTYLSTNQKHPITKVRAYQIINSLSRSSNSPFIIEKSSGEGNKSCIKLRNVEVKEQ